MGVLTACACAGRTGEVGVNKSHLWLKLMRGDNQSLAKKTVWGNILWRFAGPGPGCSCKPAPQFVNQPLVTLRRVGLSPSVVSPGIVMGRPYGAPTSCPKRRGKGQCAYC